MKRCVAYGRVSTDSEEQKTSIESQRAYYENKFKGDGYSPSPCGMLYRKNGEIEPLTALYLDEGISGTKLKNRKAFEQMLDDAKQGKFEIIYVKSVSRFARNTVDGIQTVRELKHMGVGVVFEDWNINTLEMQDETVLTIAFAQAQTESQVKSRNVKWGIKQRQKTGKWFNAEALGYRKIPNGLEIDHREAEIVRTIFRLYTKEGMSLHGIAVYLNDNPEIYPTKRGGKWSKNNLGAVLSNPVYVGLLRSHVRENGDILDVEAKARVIPQEEQYLRESPELQIIDNDTWDRAREIMKAREARYSTVDLRGRNTSGYLLSTLLVCQHCGVTFARKKRRAYRYKDNNKDMGYCWVCRNFNMYGKKACGGGTSILEEEAEEQVKAEIRKLQTDILENNGGSLRKNFTAYLKVMYELDHETENLEEIKTQLVKIERKQNILLEDRADGILSKDLYQKQIKALNTEREELEERLRANDMYEGNLKKEWEKFEKYTKRILSLDLDNLSNSDVKQVFDKIYVGAYAPEGKKRATQKYLVFSYAVMGHSVQEIIQMY